MINNISFTSAIRPVTVNQFMNSARMSCKSVDYPWTIRESVLSENAYTTNVMDCTVCGITDGSKVLMMHICPTNEMNKNFSKISKFIKDKISQMNPELQAVVIGGKPAYTHGKESYALFDKFTNLLTDLKIPFSKLKGGMGEKHVAYIRNSDEWLVASQMVERPQPYQLKSPEKELNKLFNEVDISELDEVRW